MIPPFQRHTERVYFWGGGSWELGEFRCTFFDEDDAQYSVLMFLSSAVEDLLPAQQLKVWAHILGDRLKIEGETIRIDLGTWDYEWLDGLFELGSGGHPYEAIRSGLDIWSMHDKVGIPEVNSAFSRSVAYLLPY